MAKEKDNVLLWHSFIDVMLELTDEETKEVLRAFKAYIKNEPISFTQRGAEIAWKGISLQLDADKKKWDATCERNRQNGQSGGRPRKPIESEENPKNPLGYFASKNQKQNPTQPKKPDTDTDKDIYKEKIYKKENALLESAERIWKAYPKKDGKKEGIKAILKRLHEGLSEEYLLGRVKAYCVTVEGKESAYIKFAQGWFNGERYKDACLDNPTPPPAENGELDLRTFRLAYRKLHEQDFEIDYCPERARHVAILKADLPTVRDKYEAEYADIKERFSMPFSSLKKYVQKILEDGANG